MNLDFSRIDFAEGLRQIPTAIRILISTPAFISKHKLWKGLMDHRWVLLSSVFIGIAFSFTLLDDIRDYYFPKSVEPVELDILSEDSINKEQESINNSLTESKEFDHEKEGVNQAKEILEKDHKPLFSGSLKFLLLIFLEVLIFHFAVRTNNILKGENKILGFKDFYKAQIRVVKVMGRKWLYGLIMYILVSVFCGIGGIGYLKESIMFLVYGFYLGFAFLDNYLEQFDFSINKSSKMIQAHFGASTVFGIFTSIVMNVPIVGPLIVPLICGIAATRYGHVHKMEHLKVED